MRMNEEDLWYPWDASLLPQEVAVPQFENLWFSMLVCVARKPFLTHAFSSCCYLLLLYAVSARVDEGELQLASWV
jgi:hypothetical protein